MRSELFDLSLLHSTKVTDVRPASTARVVEGEMLLAAVMAVLLSAACGLSPPRFGSRAWERRGVYAGRSDMPRVADVAAAVGAPAPWQVCACSTLCLEGCL